MGLMSSIDSRRDIQEVFKNTPFDKQVMMFTATVCFKFMKSLLIEKRCEL